MSRYKKIYALASDFDNTLFFPDISYRTNDLKAIKRFQAAGNLFGINTGRPGQNLYDFLSDDISLDFGIFTSGSLIHNKKKEILFDKLMPLELACELKEFCEPYSVVTFVHANEDIYQFSEYHSFATTVLSFDEIPKGSIRGISVHSKSHEIAQEMRKAVEEKFIGKASAYTNVSGNDIVCSGCSKGISLRRIPQFFKVDTLCAIGDAENDIPQLEAADISFTFDYSRKCVQDCADYVVTSIAEAIDILLNLKD